MFKFKIVRVNSQRVLRLQLPLPSFHRRDLFFLLKTKQKVNCIIKTVGCLPQSASFNVAWLDDPFPSIMGDTSSSTPFCLSFPQPRTHLDLKDGTLCASSHFQLPSPYLDVPFSFFP